MQPDDALKERITAWRRALHRIPELGFEERQTASFREYADAKRGVVFTNSEVAELVHLMMSTPYYQLT